MSHLYIGPLAAYNSLTDKHLTGYFNNTRIRRHLQRVGLVTRSGRIVSEKEYRLNAMRKDHQKYIRECLAQAIFHKVLDMERHHQIEIKKKLEHFARKERVQKIKVERSQRAEEDTLPLFSPRPPTGPRTIFGRHTLHNADRSDSSESPSSSRPNTAPGNMQRPVRLDPLPNSASAGIVTTPKTTSATQPKNTAIELDRHCATGVDKDLMKFINTLEQPSGISPYRLPIINNFLTPVPPPKKSERNPNTTKSGTSRGRRFRPTTAPYVLDQLSPKDPVKFHKPSLHSNVAITMIYLGKNVHLSYDEMDYKDEIKVFQQHCGGENLCVYKGNLLEGETFQCTSKRHRGFPFSLTFYINGIQVDRLSSCCEYKHRKGARLGGKHGYFRFVNIEGASPCYRCIIAMGLDKKPSPPPKKRKEDLREEEGKDSNVETMVGKMRSGESSKETVQRGRSASATSSAYGADRETSEDRTEMEEDDEDEVISVFDESKEEHEDITKDDYDEDFEGDDDKVDEDINGDGHVDDLQNGRSRSPSDPGHNDLDLKEGDINSSTKAKEGSDSERDECDVYSDTECKQVEKQDSRKDSLASSSSTLYNSTSRDESDVEERLKDSGREDARRTSSKEIPTKRGLVNNGEMEDQIHTEDSADETSPGQEADTIDDETEDNEGAEDHLKRDHTGSRKDNGEMEDVNIPSGSRNGAKSVSMASFEADDEGDAKSIQEKIAEAIENPKLLNTEPEPSDSSTDEEDNLMSAAQGGEPAALVATEETTGDTFQLEDALDNNDQPMVMEQRTDETTIQERFQYDVGETAVGMAEETITATEATSENAQPEETAHAVNQEINETTEMAAMEVEDSIVQNIKEEADPTDQSLEQETTAETETSADDVKSEKEDAVAEEVAPSAEPDNMVPDNGEPVMENKTDAAVTEQEDRVEGVSSVEQQVVEGAEEAEDKSDKETPDEESCLVEEAPDIPSTKIPEVGEQKDSSPQGQVEEQTTNQRDENDEVMVEKVESQESDAEVGEVMLSREEMDVGKASAEEVIADQSALDSTLPQEEAVHGDGASSKEEPAPEQVSEEQMAEAVPNEEEAVCEEVSKKEDDTAEEITSDEIDNTKMTTPENEEDDIGPVAQEYLPGEEAATKGEEASQEASQIEQQGITEMVNEVQEETQDTTSQDNDAGREDVSKDAEDVTDKEHAEEKECADSPPEREELVQDNEIHEEESTTEDILEGENPVAETTSNQEEKTPEEDEGVIVGVNTEREEAAEEIVTEGDCEGAEIKELPSDGQEKETDAKASSVGDRNSPEPTSNANEQSGLEEKTVAEIPANGVEQEENMKETSLDESEESNKEAVKGKEDILPGDEDAVADINTNEMKQDDEITQSVSESKETTLEVVQDVDEGAPEVENTLSETAAEVEDTSTGLHSNDEVEDLDARENTKIEVVSLVAELDIEEKLTEETADGDEVKDIAANEEAHTETATSGDDAVEATPSGVDGETETEVEEIVNEENIESKAAEETEATVPEESAILTEAAEPDTALRLEESTTEEAPECVPETVTGDQTAEATETDGEVVPDETDVTPVVEESITMETSNRETPEKGETEPSNELEQKLTSEESTTEDSVGLSFGHEGSADESKDVAEVLEGGVPHAGDAVLTMAAEEGTIPITISNGENMESRNTLSPTKPEEDPTGEEGSSSNQ